MTQFEQIIKTVAQKYGLTQELVEAIGRSEFEFLVHTMESANVIEHKPKGVHLQYLGTFRVNDTRYEKLREKYIKKQAEKELSKVQ